jgi:hypothetical protein
MLDTPLVRGERVVLAEVGGVRLDMVRNKDIECKDGHFLFKPSRPHALTGTQGTDLESNITYTSRQSPTKRTTFYA